MYLDPAFGGMLLQVIIAIVAVGGGIIYSFRRKIKAFFSRNKNETRKVVEQSESGNTLGAIDAIDGIDEVDEIDAVDESDRLSDVDAIDEIDKRDEVDEVNEIAKKGDKEEKSDEVIESV